MREIVDWTCCCRGAHPRHMARSQGQLHAVQSKDGGTVKSLAVMTCRFAIARGRPDAQSTPSTFRHCILKHREWLCLVFLSLFQPFMYNYKPMESPTCPQTLVREFASNTSPARTGFCRNMCNIWNNRLRRGNRISLRLREKSGTWNHR